MSFHRNQIDDDIHVVNARTFADVTARNADTDFQITENINKMVRVDSPISYFILASVGPTVWTEAGSTGFDEFLELTDTPSTYSGQAGKVPQVNVAEDALEFASVSIFGCAFVNDNLTANGTIINNTFTDIVFGTGGDALVECSNVEGWGLFDELNGTFEYTGTDAFSGIIHWDFAVVSSGGTLEYKLKWQKDTGGGFVDLTDNVEAIVDVASITRNVSKTQPLTAVTGNKIKPQITRLSGSSGITIRYATINVSQ